MSLLDLIPWFNKPAQPPKPKNHWDGCDDGFYVYDYREKLDELASEIRAGVGPIVYTRFNRRLKAAEILTDRNGIIARVNVHGSECAPYEAIVHLKDFSHRELFRKLFGKLSIEFRELTT